jgi:hypothetical protein
MWLLEFEFKLHASVALTERGRGLTFFLRDHAGPRH